jgi:hypothetical protein
MRANAVKNTLKKLVKEKSSKDELAPSSLNNTLRGFWELEHIGITSSTSMLETELTNDELLAIDLIKKESYYDASQKRWFTSLLWKTDRPALGTNYKKCLQLMFSVEKSAEKKQLLDLVNESYEKFLLDNFAERLEISDLYKEEQTSPPCSFIPSFPVYSLDRISTRCRIVYNCSSITETGASLNSCLLTGPKLLPDLAKLLIQFRTGKISILADLKSQFLNFYLHKKSDMDCLRYLWRQGNSQSPPIQYRFRSLLFGGSHSPYSAIWLTQAHATKFKADFPLASDIVLNALYMDDLTYNVDNEEIAKESLIQLNKLFELASIKMHKFMSNNQSVLKVLDPHQISPQDKVKVFGFPYDPTADIFHFKFTSLSDSTLPERLTKRKLLSEIAQVWDIIGITQPIILGAKIMMQQLWLLSLKWDDAVPTEMLDKWYNLRKQFIKLNGLKFPRFLFSPVNRGLTVVSNVLVTFCDASDLAYNATVYLVTTYSDNSTSCNFIISKSRVVPLQLLRQHTNKPHTPRVELLAMTVAARLGKYAKEALESKITLTTWKFLTDSSINFFRLFKPINLYRTWISNRLKEILTISQPSDWLHVRSDLNPSDIGSRPSDVDSFLTNPLWLQGPDFLRLPMSEWKNNSSINSQTQPEVSFLEDDEVSIPTKVLLTKQEQNSTELFFSLFNRFGSWQKTVRLFANILRFGHPGHRKFRRSSYTAAENLATEHFLLKQCQQVAFSTEIDLVQKNERMPKNSPLLSLNPFLRDGLLCSNSRLSQSADLTLTERFPIILPKKDPIVTKLILHIHASTLHSNVTYLLTFVRSKYILLGGRRELRRIIKTCVNLRCKRIIPAHQIMAPLPTERITQADCFSLISIDYFGPLYYIEHQSHKKTEVKKCWVALYTCLISRAIHLELILDNTTIEFLNSFRLFVSRRGLPSSILSDNFSSFKKADKELKQLFSNINWDRVATFFAHKNISWKFVLPYSPWLNSPAEALVKSSKICLKKVIGQSRLSLRNLQVVLSEVEGLLNSRPLTVQYDMIPLTPGELLYGRRLLELPDPPTVVNLDFPEFWRKKKAILNKCWQTWRTTYLYSLSLRKKWQFPLQEDLLDKLVLINDKLLPKNVWKIGRIINVVKSKSDGKIRTVQLKTASGIIFRSINNLSFFEGDLLPPLPSATDGSK